MAKQQDISLEIKEWGSMRDTGRNFNNQPLVILNYRFDGTYLRTRPPHKRVMDNTTSGNYSPVGYGTFKRNGNIEKIFAHPNGRLWTQRSDSAAPVALTLGGANALPTNVTRVRMCQYFSRLYIIVYGGSPTAKLLEYDGTTNTVTDRTSTLPAGVTTPVSIFKYGTRLGVADEQGEIVLSKSDANITTDPTPWDTSNGAFSFIVGRGDGLTISNIASASGILAISKELTAHRLTTLDKLTGATASEYRQDIVSPTHGFYGQGAVEIGSDIFGLHPAGFDMLRVLDQFGEGTLNTQRVNAAGLTGEVPKWIQKILEKINKNKTNIIIATYNALLNEVYFSVPYGDNSNQNNLIIGIARRDNQYKYFLMTGPAQAWFQANGFVYFMDHRGEIWQMFNEDASSPEEGQYHKLIVTKWFDMLPDEDNTETISAPFDFLAQSVDVDIEGTTDKQKINIFWDVENIDKDTGTIRFSNNRKVGDEDLYKTAEKILSKWTQLHPTKLDLVITDIDTFDTAQSLRAIKTARINQQASRVRVIISDDSAGLANLHTIRGLKINAIPTEVK